VPEINKVAIRFKDGRVLKGSTRDFMPGKPLFHVYTDESPQASEIKMEDLKAVFFVKDFEGRPEYSEVKIFPEKLPTSKGRKIAVLFTDGELLTGFTLAYDPKRSGFFMLPADDMSNNDRIYVVASAVKEVGFGRKADTLVSEVMSSQASRRSPFAP
jgi:hypothetical protein